MLYELVAIQQQIEAAESLANGIIIALQEQKNGKRTTTNDENVLFTLEIKSPDE